MFRRGYIIAATLIGATTAQAVTPKIPTYQDILALYRANPERARELYGDKRLFFQGYLVRTTDRTAEYFRVTDPDGVEFGAHFGAKALGDLSAKFPGGEIKRGVKSGLVNFSCVNRGLEKAGAPALILSDCRAGS